MSSVQPFGMRSSGLPYRDPTLSVEDRVADLLSRMTVEEKAGQMFHTMIFIGPGGTLSEADGRHDSTETLVGEKLMSHFNLVGSVENVREAAEWHNRLQQRALQTRLGIPITLSTDPRNHFTDNVGTASMAGAFSQWPETLGLAALRSANVVERFGDIVRQEYAALGLRVGLHPQIDLATEPRWARIGATFGEDADLSSELVAAYIRGFHGKDGKLGPESVSTMTKHFPGGGAQKDGEDAHFQYGREQIYPGGFFEYHLKPFRAAIAAGATQIMPYYGMPIGTTYEEVGFAFSKGIITGILREELGFRGLVCTDWGLITDVVILGQDMPGRAWGVEHLSEIERAEKIINAGCDQFGGEARPELVIKLVEEGRITLSRIDESVARILHEKFALGLFDQPFIDVDKALRVVGRKDFCNEGDLAQRRAYTLLKNESNILPLCPMAGKKIYIEGIEASNMSNWTIVDNPAEADIALLRLKAPYEPRPGGFEARFHAGSLAYQKEEQERQAAIFKAVPTVVDVYLDRPAVIPEIADAAAALLVSYGSSSEAFLDVVCGRVGPEGKLPFDLPSSMDAAVNSRSDVPYDTKDPVFKFGHGLKYTK